jgi:release factor glutamine methyltransferase
VSEPIRAALRRAGAVLAAAGVEAPEREARLLLRHALGLAPGAPLDPAAGFDPARFAALLARRARREPMAYITGRRGFWSLDLAVTPAVLIPRADSETLITAALAALPERGAVRRILDLGTGSGALLLAGLSEFPRAWGVGADRSPAAAALAAANARGCGLGGRAGFVCADWAAPILARFDLVLCNPPYVRTGDIAGLMPEVAAFEPRAALDGGPDGLDAYRLLLPDLPRLLAPAGVAVFELGQGQAESVGALARASGLSVAGLHQDLGGIVRALVLRAAAG